MSFVRAATLDDAAACAAVYAPYVTDTAVSFEVEPPSAAAMGERIGRALERYAWLVAEDGDGRVVGYAYGGAFAPRAAYRFSCEVSVYLELGRRRTGAGRALYTALLPALAARGYRRAFAGMTLPNAASAGLHRALGFEPSGIHRQVGYKDGAWHDVAWLQKSLAPDDTPLVEPR
ncbi:Phosphinothricin N-acetyltransferase [Baekduia alba]|uniref:GNAT family N-acetyltransferase n=1 Tax=Baekduia alba TaxID=2997333 RepID=UPI0023419C6D|nr:GNAT family N-acetyltransferase [Baekduia alba]WCB93531.1 Phosphinothricin N-acetyltransferase [Baekduia alba]